MKASLLTLALLTTGGGAEASLAQADTVSFAPTGGEQAFTVPAGVSTINVLAVGGRGGQGFSNAMPGAFGALVVADLAVSPGQILYVEVGGNGTGQAAGGSGGFNGGADGGAVDEGSFGGGGGGGASDVRTTPLSAALLGTRLITAGGGGGSGGGSSAAGYSAGAGGTGGSSGGNGSPGTSGGAGGMGATPTSGGINIPPFSLGNGAFGDGGHGQSAGGDEEGGGGGGGGGYFGGSGGYAGSIMKPGGGGGGGSSGFGPGASVVAVGSSSNPAASITFTYTPPASPVTAQPITTPVPTAKKCKKRKKGRSALAAKKKCKPK